MLPPIDLPQSKDFRGGGTPERACIICNRSIKTPKYFIVLDECLGSVVDPTTPEPNGGCHLVGEDCLRKHGLKNYSVKIQGEW